MSTYDRDNDGLSDTSESFRRTNPDVADSDGDTVSDGDEVDLGWDPLKADPVEKVDRMRGGLQLAREELDKSYEDARDMFKDTDGDGLDNRTERHRGLNPFDEDTDDDGLNDGFEVQWGLDPKDNLPDPPEPAPKVPMRLDEPAASAAAPAPSAPAPAPSPAVEPIEAEQLTAVDAAPAFEEVPSYESEAFAAADQAVDDGLSLDTGDGFTDASLEA